METALLFINLYLYSRPYTYVCTRTQSSKLRRWSQRKPGRHRARRIRNGFSELTSCVGMTCHARREYLAQNCNIFSVLSILKYNP